MKVAGFRTRILLVDDEHSVQKLLTYLRKEGDDVVSALDGREALNRLREDNFDLVVLDVMLPKVDGFDVCRQIRARSTVPIIMLTAKAEEIDKVLGLELGADDYITKPFSVREFRSRVKAVLRRAELSRGDETLEEPIEEDDLRVDFEKRHVDVRGEPVRLTYVEFEILAALARSPGRVFSRTMLLERVWGDSAYRDPRTVDVHIRHLREKLERDPRNPELIFTVRGWATASATDDQAVAAEQASLSSSPSRRSPSGHLLRGRAAARVGAARPAAQRPSAPPPAPSRGSRP